MRTAAGCARAHCTDGVRAATLKTMVPLLVLGSARLATTKGLDYQACARARPTPSSRARTQEHVSEYGVHWNFFYTLASGARVCVSAAPSSGADPSVAQWRCLCRWCGPSQLRACRLAWPCLLVRLRFCYSGARLTLWRPARSASDRPQPGRGGVGADERECSRRALVCSWRRARAASP